MQRKRNVNKETTKIKKWNQDWQRLTETVISFVPDIYVKTVLKMVRVTSVAFWMASASVAMLFISYILPYWFGRYDDRGVSRNYGLFYRIECSVDQKCRVYHDILDSTTLPINGRSWKGKIHTIHSNNCGFIFLPLFYCLCCSKF